MSSSLSFTRKVTRIFFSYRTSEHTDINMNKRKVVCSGHSAPKSSCLYLVWPDFWARLLSCFSHGESSEQQEASNRSLEHLDRHRVFFSWTDYSPPASLGISRSSEQQAGSNLSLKNLNKYRVSFPGTDYSPPASLGI